MKAELIPLSGKYYGTKIKLIFDDKHEETMTLWDCDNYEPSDRELNDKCTIKQWRNNELIQCDISKWQPDGTIRARELIDICDSHFESRKTLERAQEIVRLLNTQQKNK